MSRLFRGWAELRKYFAASYSSLNAIMNLENLIQKSNSHIYSRTLDLEIRNFCDEFSDMNVLDKRKTFEYLASKSSDEKRNKESARSYLHDPSVRNEENLRNSLVPSYVSFFQKIGSINEGGVKFLVDFRSDLLEIFPNPSSNMKTLNGQLKYLLSNWFTMGFLNLEQMTWDSPCSMLQKISDYEAVHPMRNWTDLKARVGTDRRCFVYTHRSMPGEPIVVLHTALTNNIPGNISSIVKDRRGVVKKFSSVDLISEKKSDDAYSAAIFYSITSTQKGLRGIELGTHLIHQAVLKLKNEFSSLDKFSTLSPIPTFKSYFLTQCNNCKRHSDWSTVFTEKEIAESTIDFESFVDTVKNNHWIHFHENEQELYKRVLLRSSARYLILEKRRKLSVDPVANFHLRNGATIWRLNWKGDVSLRGLDNSFGIMVNYRYYLNELETHSMAYQEKYVVSVDEQVQMLL